VRLLRRPFPAAGAARELLSRERMSMLCATNFSPEAIAATTVAAELCRQRGEDLWLMFVLPESSARAFGEAILSTADATLKGEAARARKLGAQVTPVLLTGKLHKELPRFVAENKIDLVVAGDTHKEPNFIGTGTLARLAQHLNAPLWVVRDSAPLIAWAKGQRALKVMLAMDRTQSTRIAARWLSTLSRTGKLEVVGAHVYWPVVEAQRMGLPLPRTWDEQQPEVLESLHHELLEMLPAGLSQRIRIAPALGRASEHVNAMAAEEGVDLLVLGTHGRQALGQLWSVSEQCLQLAPVSVVSIPAGAEPVVQKQALHQVERVLAATDFSPTGDGSIPWALSILAEGGTAELVHIIPRQVSAMEERELVEQLLARVPLEVRARRLNVKGHLLIGTHPAQAIAAAAERFNSQVICLGSRGHSGLVRLALGSTTQAVLTGSRRPVMVVQPPLR
jgi:nucleotide-binding universal stress UspA family protein